MTCDSCGKPPLKRTRGASFLLDADIGEHTYGLIVRLCGRGCADTMRDYIRSHKTTEPPELRTAWGGDPFLPLRADV